ncbi:MAG: peptidoglycan-binding domain-containing protein [Ilumatobacteraceae bacterium]
MEVSGRPVFVFQGALPTYRSFEPGMTGPDVQQLEEALARLGFDPGTVDTVYDDATEAAIDQLYESKGYQSEGPTEEQRSRLRTAEKAVADAQAALTRANADLTAAGTPVSGAELLRQQQALQAAKDAVPTAEATATRRNTDAAAAVTAATTVRDAARTARDAARVTRDAAVAPGAIDPATGEPYATAELKLFEDDLAAKEAALVTAEADLRRTISERDTTATEVAAAIVGARDALALAELTYAEAVAPKDTSAARDAVASAQAILDQARADLRIEQFQVGTKMPAGEMIFLPTVPTTVTSVDSAVGKAPTEPVGTASSTRSQIRGRSAPPTPASCESAATVDIEPAIWTCRRPGW